MIVTKIAVEHFVSKLKEQEEREDEYYLILIDEAGQEYEYRLEKEFGDWLNFIL